MNTARFLKYAWPFYNIMHERVKTSIVNLNFGKKETKSHIRELQTITVSGTVKIVKTFIRFKM